MNVKLSILLVTYNHEKYIHQSMQALFKQKIDASVELVIADDCSSDKTLDIIREYEGKDSRFHFKYFENTSNLGITKNYQRGFAACTGEFVAVLEGDDYWVSPLKLQRQIDFLENHWESNLCSVNYFVYDDAKSQFTPRTTIGHAHRFIGARDLIFDNLVGNFSTCMYRKTALDLLPPELFEIKSYDWIINICIARQSLIGFLETPMSVYRLHSAGVWTQKTKVEKLKEQLNIIPAYDALTDYIFHPEFDLLASNLKKIIKVKRIVRSVDELSAPVTVAAITLQDYIPPVLIAIARATTPPKLKCFFKKILHRDRVA